MSEKYIEKILANRYGLRKVIVRQESKITVDVVAGKPPTATI